LVVAFMGTVIFLFNFLKSDESDAGITQVEEIAPVQSLIGRSVEGRAIDAFTFGSGDTHVVFVGGVHGGYEWNSVVLAYEIIDYLEEHPESIPENLRISVVPSANPDGVYKVIGKEGRFSSEDALKVADTVPGRFNANNVDLNRNFDCKWQPESMWRGQKVSAGLSPFSEPESVALRDFILKNNPVAVVFWHSQSNAVYASECTKGILPGTLAIMRAYSLASGYRAIESFDQYEITGDAEGWLASIGIPAITVELETHETVEFNRNLAGVKALIEYYTP
jgi:g-D-glutamyl-meso-diaminopimelate peptidase